jgi:hypothetical protein
MLPYLRLVLGVIFYELRFDRRIGAVGFVRLDESLKRKQFIGSSLLAM